MLGIGIPGPTELIIISGVLVVLFGASRLPKMAHAIGSSVSQFTMGLRESKKALREMSENAKP